MQASPHGPMMDGEGSSPTAFFSANPPTPVHGMSMWDDPSMGVSSTDPNQWFSGVEPSTFGLVSTASPDAIGAQSVAPAPPPPPPPPPPPLETDPSSAPAPLSNLPSAQRVSPTLTIHPTHFKSRVETQVPIRLYLHPMPPGVTKLHLPPYAISKPKLMANPAPAKSPDTLELTAMLVCASAMEREGKLQQAFARAAGHPESSSHVTGSPTTSSSSSSSSGGSSPVDGRVHDKRLDGADVRICTRCIDRERKRAARKKNWSLEEQEIFGRDEHLRVIVFNTTEIKDWQSISPNSGKDAPRAGTPPEVPGDAMQVNLPMRIACYCRHHNEKQGFRVIFTLKDHRGALVAQAITTSIMITDDHKTHPMPPTFSTQPPVAVSAGPGVPPTGLVADPLPPHMNGLPIRTPVPHQATHPNPAETILPQSASFASLATSGFGHAPVANVIPFRLSHSSSDLTSLRRGEGPGTQTAATATATAAAAAAAAAAATAAAAHTREGWRSKPPSVSSRSSNPSRQASPTPMGPASKRRKPSRESRLPPDLVMTRLDNPAANATAGVMPSKLERDVAATATSMPSLYSPAEPVTGVPTPAQFAATSSPVTRRPFHFSTGPPTPIRSFFPSDPHAAYPGQIIIPQAFSAPTSARHSRAPSPTSAFHQHQHQQHQQHQQHLFALQQAQMAQESTNGSHTSSKIARMMPATGPKSGCVEVSCLGEHFHEGLEVMFGDVVATTTTFWNEGLLVCLVPPRATPGDVVIRFRHEVEAAQPLPHNTTPVVFHYFEDDEDQRMRSALMQLGYHLDADDNAYAFARRVIQQAAMQPNGFRADAPFGPPGGSADDDSEDALLGCLNMIDFSESPHRARLDLRRPTGHTMLHLACAMGLRRFVAALLVRGVSPDTPDLGGFTPLHFAALCNHPSIVRRLLLAGADPARRSLAGFLPASMTTSSDVLSIIESSESYTKRHAAGSERWRWGTTIGQASLGAGWGDAAFLRPRSSGAADGRHLARDEWAGVFVDGRYAEAPKLAVENWGNVPMLRANQQSNGGHLEPAEMHQSGGGGFTSPPTAILAWRDHLAAQLCQLQQVIHGNLPTLPQIPALPPMPALPGYYASLGNPMVRLGSLVPSLNGAATAGGGVWAQDDPSSATASSEADPRWWDRFSSSSPPSPPPPAYDDLYPRSDEGAGSHDPNGDDCKVSYSSPGAVGDFKCAIVNSRGAGYGDGQLNQSSLWVDGPEELRLSTSDEQAKVPLKTSEPQSIETRCGIASKGRAFFLWVSNLLYTELPLSLPLFLPLSSSLYLSSIPTPNHTINPLTYTPPPPPKHLDSSRRQPRHQPRPRHGRLSRLEPSSNRSVQPMDKDTRQHQHISYHLILHAGLEYRV